MRLLVDTLAFRTVSTTFTDLCDLLGLKKDIVWEVRGNFNGYKKSYYYNGIRIGVDGENGFLSYLYMSGKGCRTFEDISDVEWSSLLNMLAYNPAEFHIARIDIACDDYTDTLKIEKLYKYYLNNKYATRSKYITFVQGSEEIMYVGSPQSDKRLRIYNKKLERGYSAEDTEYEHWYRAELQLRDNSAANFLKEFWNCQNLGSVYYGILREHIRFLSRPNDKKNSQRIPEAAWWVRFCQDSRRIVLPGRVGSEYNLSKVERYLTKQAGSNIKTLIRAEQLTPEQFFNRFNNDNSIKLRSDQLQLIKEINDDRQRKA